MAAGHVDVLVALRWDSKKDFTLFELLAGEGVHRVLGAYHFWTVEQGRLFSFGYRPAPLLREIADLLPKKVVAHRKRPPQSPAYKPAPGLAVLGAGAFCRKGL